MDYIGEHLLPGQIGHLATILSFSASLLATVAFFKANKLTAPAEKQSWLRLARICFAIETIAVVAILSSIYYILANHLFEYKYAWEHSDKTLQTQYVFSCLWEGQEGSFLLWNIWHCVLGWVIIGTAKKWEAPVMTVISFAQSCIATMLLGIYFFKTEVGLNPFILLRDTGLLDNAPVFKDAATGALRSDYLSMLQDGSGLNALLQNYWMVIHPPILFLGFASTVVPFAFAYAGLVNNDHGWTKAALPWALFSGAILGTGIMMGAAWAYESLSFGGYWAWDPVENASLVPWMVMIAGIHTNLIYNSSKYSLKSTYLFYILSFSLILYSTFLTRSGILGDTSVHAFTGADMNVQLLSFVVVFFVPAMVLYFIRRKSIPSIAKEENLYSREFWMFIGALVMFLSAIIIIAKTSLPVYNKIFGTSIAPPEDPVFSYNQIQVFIAVIIGILTAVTQYFKYKSTPKALFGKKIWLPTLIALAVSVSISIWGNIDYTSKGAGFLFAIHLAIFASVYAVVANAFYLLNGMRGKLKAAGASVAHVGFGIFLLGILISSSKKQVLSLNTTGINVFEKTKDQDPAENITLFKGVKTDMGKYDVTYVRDTQNNFDRKMYFEVKFASKDGKENFTLYPDVMKINKGQQTPSANPDKEHYWNRDVFTYVTAWQQGEADENATFKPLELKVGDTAFYSNGMLVLNQVLINPQNNKRSIPSTDTAMVLDMTVISKEGNRYPIQPQISFSLRTNQFLNFPDTAFAQNLIVRFNRISTQDHSKLEIGIQEDKRLNDLMTAKVYEFPFIALVWLGVIIMVIGTLQAMWYRIYRNKISTNTQ